MSSYRSRPAAAAAAATATARRSARGAFTLVELMASVAMVLLLVIGINGVFRIATDTIATGQGLSESVANNRSVQTVLFNDFQQSVIRSEDAPFFIIRSSVQSAFLDQEDMLSDRDYQTNPSGTPAVVDGFIRSIDINGDGDEIDTADGEVLQRNNLTRRNHRQDVMCFFARHLYPRQTGNPGFYTADMTCNEAWIWYGHLRQPRDHLNTAGVNMDPGPESGGTVTPQTNPNNFYARQWGLGRVAMLLREPTDTPPFPANGIFEIFDKGGVSQQYMQVSAPGPNPYANYSPLGQGSRSGDNSLIEWSRYDLAGTTIDGIRERLKNQATFSQFPWGGGVPRWYGGGGFAHRFAGYPFPTSPLDSYGTARTAPWLVGGCTQFIVEFAGDYLEQVTDPAAGVVGTVTDSYRDNMDGDPGPATDGLTDFYVDATGNQRIRWYGHPRDTGGTTLATVNQPDGTITNGTTIAAVQVSPDVLPLRDFLGGAGRNNTRASAEHFVDSAMTAEYNGTPATPQPALTAEYVMAWQPAGTYVGNDTAAEGGTPLPDTPRPRMLRITMTIDDPAGRLPEGQTYEYVIELP